MQAKAIKSIGLTALAAVLLATLAYTGFKQLNRSHGETRNATAVTIDAALDTSPVVVIGKVINGEGKPRNLRRDSVDPTKEDQSVSVPGTDYVVKVSKVLKGDLKPNSNINVAVPGGSYKGETSSLRATLVQGEEYVFALAKSPSGPTSYYGMIEPYIFQLKNNKVVAIINDNKIKSAFKETNISEAELINKLTK
ncbi:hypothetical protein [Paenibacillus caui]|uniref:hypothetical protein n=1 Tax=Paenibacillus caui TaxID=2873927 RepID=UPI001CA832D8|nr:hypothetical protein [Paenibacillus caui]